MGYLLPPIFFPSPISVIHVQSQLPVLPDGPATGVDTAPPRLLAGAGGGPITAPEEEEEEDEAITLETSLEGEVMERPAPPMGENPGEP